MYDYLIKNGKILDGCGNPWYRADLAISDGHIVKIAPDIDGSSHSSIDVEGLLVCPGFIDMHTHWDLRVFSSPSEEEKLRQGIITSLIGQDGLSVAPVNDKTVQGMRLRVSGLLGSKPEKWNWQSMEEYLNAIRGTKPVTNYMMLVPHGNVRSMVVGWDNRPANDEEIEEMKSILGESMDQGACGFSTGLIYPPGMFADKKELVELCRTTGEKGGFFVVHMRDEGNYLVDSIKEVAEICIEAGCPLHISHLKVAGKKNWGKSKEALDVIEQMRSRGLDLTFDQYPYTAGSTMLDALIPPRFHSGGTEKLVERLLDKETAEEIREVIEGEIEERWENWIAHCGWDGILINSVASEANKYAEGKTLMEISKITGQTPFEALSHLFVSEKGRVTMTQFYGSEEDVRSFMKSDYMTFCTDAIAGGKPHPRAYGSTCRFIEKFVLQNKDLTLPQAIQRMTSRPAQRLGLQDRGILREGMCADITILDSGSIHDTGTYRDPANYPSGIVHVMVNGAWEMLNGKLRFSQKGKVLRG